MVKVSVTIHIWRRIADKRKRLISIIRLSFLEFVRAIQCLQKNRYLSMQLTVSESFLLIYDVKCHFSPNFYQIDGFEKKQLYFS